MDLKIYRKSIGQPMDFYSLRFPFQDAKKDYPPKFKAVGTFTLDFTYNTLI